MFVLMLDLKIISLPSTRRVALYTPTQATKPQTSTPLRQRKP